MIISRPTAPSRIHNIGRALPTVSICSGTTRADQRTLDGAPSLCMAAASAVSSACACSTVTPAFNRATILR
jgi:hypothetical protein